MSPEEDEQRPGQLRWIAQSLIAALRRLFIKPPATDANGEPEPWWKRDRPY